jgi:hypothetical protein
VRISKVTSKLRFETGQQRRLFSRRFGLHVTLIVLVVSRTSICVPAQEEHPPKMEGSQKVFFGC